jgi:hypothetical protein
LVVEGVRAATKLPLVEVVETDDAERRGRRTASQARGDFCPDADLAAARAEHDGEEQRDDRLDEHRHVERPHEVRQRRAPHRSRADLADDGGSRRRGREDRERDGPRRRDDRLAADDLRQLGGEDRVYGDHRDRQDHVRRVRERLRVADGRRPALVDDRGEPVAETSRE